MPAVLTAHRQAHAIFLAKALGASLIIALSAHIKVPFWPVPMTMQTCAVMTIAALFGRNLGVAAMLAYLTEGLLGLPVFASGIGPAVLVGPTAGYLMGMVVAAAIVGRASGHVATLAALVLGTMVIYVFGAGWLATFIGMDHAWSAGVLPFLLGDVAKGALAWALSGALPAVLPALRRG